MSTDPCIGPFYDCGENVNYSYTAGTSASITQTRDNLSHFLLGETDIIVNKVTRYFNLTIGKSTSASGSVAIGNGLGGSVPCVTQTDSNSGSVSESYQCTNTILSFLDTRYGNAIGREVIESLAFSADGSQLAAFRGAMFGNFYGHKFMVENSVIHTTTNYFIVVNGVKTILKTVTSISNQYTANNPLILVFPNPPSLGEPFDADVIKYGFYDYHATGAGEGQSKIQQDGGDDFYFTDWMRDIGIATRDADQKKATDRYDQFYLGNGIPKNVTYANPGINIDDNPIGSITIDAAGNVCYSMLLNGQTFNFLTNGDLPNLTGLDAAGFKCFPVGLV